MKLYVFGLDWIFIFGRSRGFQIQLIKMMLITNGTCICYGSVYVIVFFTAPVEYKYNLNNSNNYNIMHSQLIKSTLTT